MQGVLDYRPGLPIARAFGKAQQEFQVHRLGKFGRTAKPAGARVVVLLQSGNRMF
jgi:hypothetical protein